VEVLRKALRGVLVQLQALVEPPSVERTGPPPVDDPALALLRRVADQGGRMNKLEVHQAAREVGLDRAALARMYSADPPLLSADKQDRVVTGAGQALLAEPPP